MGEQIKLLRSLATLHKFEPTERQYLKEWQAVALEADSIPSFYDASLLLAYYYCNYNQKDELFAIFEQVKAIAHERNEQPTVLFDIRNRICRHYLMNEEYEIAMNEVISLLRDMGKAGYEAGFVVANENLALIYLLIGQYKNSVEPLEKNLILLGGTNERLMHQIQMMSYLANAYMHLNELDKLKQLLDHYLQKLDAEYAVDSNFRDKNNAYCSVYSYLINYYVVKQDEERAQAMVVQATRHMDGVTDPGYTTIYYLALARYYHLTKNYHLALEYVDKTIQLDYSLEPLEQKIAIQTDAGEVDGALATYKEVVALVNKQNVDTYTRQIDQLKGLHYMIEKEKQEQLLESQEIEINYKQRQLIIFFVVTCILVVILLGVVRYALKARKLKDALEKEQLSLKQSTEYLRAAKERAVEADRKKTDFVSNVSHEIRTPLNAIVGFSTLLDEVSKEEQDEFIFLINENTDLLLKLVNDVLDLSKLEADSFVLEVVDVDVLSSCQELLDAVRHRRAAGVELTFTHPDTPLVLKTDSSRLQQMLLNLLINATKYTEKGAIHLDYRLDEATQEVVFSVSDTGCGIPLEMQESVFNRFEKIDSFKQGVGLGLPICREIASRLGGTITIDPGYTEGTRFIFRLPKAGLNE